MKTPREVMSDVTRGPLRVKHIKDGYYVIGKGHFISVDSLREGEALIEEINKGDKNGTSKET